MNTTMTANEINQLNAADFFSHTFTNEKDGVTRKLTAVSSKYVWVKITHWGVDTHERSRDMDEVFYVTECVK